MTITICDRFLRIPELTYHLAMMLVSLGVVATFGFYVVTNLRDGFRDQSIYAMSMCVYVRLRVCLHAYHHFERIAEHLWFSLALGCSGVAR